MPRPVCLLTGGTAGIGLAAATELSRRGYLVLIVGSTRSKGIDAERQIQAEVPHAAVRFLQADLSGQAEVRALAQRVLAEHDRIDLLIHNAGTVSRRREVSADGIEVTWAVNHLAPFLLTHLVLERMIATAPGRILVVSSASHAHGRIHWDDPGLEKTYHVYIAYSQSKLANVLFAYELARRIAPTGVTANAVHPGFVNTRMGRTVGGVMGWGWGLAANLFGRTPKEGAEPIVHVATSQAAADWNGLYIDPHGPRRSSRASYSEQDAVRLWRLSADQTGIPEAAG